MLWAYRSRAGSELSRQGWRAIVTPWLQWDANWYVWIARVGYGPLSPVHTNGQTYDALVWPPLFPGLVAGLSGPFHLDQGLTALVLASACLAAGLVATFRVVQLDHGQSLATWTVVLLLVFPSALFLGAGYTESLLLALAAWSFWAAQRGHWLLAGALLAAAVLTKFYAVIFVVALLTEYGERHGWSRHRIRADVAWLVVLPVLALGTWVAYVQVHFGNATRILTDQRYWGRSLAPPWVAVGAAAKNLGALHFVGVVDLGSLALLIGLTVYTAMRGRRSYAVMLGLAALSFVTTSTLASTSRNAIVLFPMFLAAAMVLRTRPWLGRGVVIVSATLMLLMLGRYATGQWAG